MLFIVGLAPGLSVSRIAIVLLSTAAVALWAAPVRAAEPLSLGEAEALALDAEPGREALVARADAIAERARAADALPEPQLRVGLNNYPIESGDFSTEGMTSASLGIRQAFPPGASRRLESEQLDWQAEATRETAFARNGRVLSAVRSAWLDVYYWQQAEVQVRSTRPFFEDLVTITESLYSVGRNTQQDVLRAELELSRLEDRLIDIERHEAVARARLREWIGNAAGRPLAQELPAWNAIPVVEDLLPRLEEHPELRAAEADLEARRKAVALANEKKKPGWMLDVGYAYRDGELTPGNPRSDFVTIGVTVGLPFTRRDSIDSRLTAALGERTAAELDREQRRRALESNLFAEHARFEELTRRLALFDSRILAQVRAQAVAALDAYRSDTADFADVMRAYIDDLDTRTEYLRLSVERASGYAALAYLGGL